MIKVINKKKESEVLDIAVAEALEICASIDPFREYEHPPPDTMRVCDRLLGQLPYEIINLIVEIY